MGEPEGSNLQGHSEQPQPRKRFSSIQMSLRVAAIYRRKTKSRVQMFCTILLSLSLEYAASFNALTWPFAGIGATRCFDTPRSKSSAQRVWVPSCTFGASTHKRQRVGSQANDHWRRRSRRSSATGPTAGRTSSRARRSSAGPAVSSTADCRRALKGAG